NLAHEILIVQNSLHDLPAGGQRIVRSPPRCTPGVIPPAATVNRKACCIVAQTSKLIRLRCHGGEWSQRAAGTSQTPRDGSGRSAACLQVLLVCVRSDAPRTDIHANWGDRRAVISVFKSATAPG